MKVNIGFEMPHSLLSALGSANAFTHIIQPWLDDPHYLHWVCCKSPKPRILDNGGFEMGTDGQASWESMLESAEKVEADVVQLPETHSLQIDAREMLYRRIRSLPKGMLAMGVAKGADIDEYTDQVSLYESLGVIVGLPYFCGAIGKSVEWWRLHALMKIKPKRVHLLGFGGNLGLLYEELRVLKAIGAKEVRLDTSWPLALGMARIRIGQLPIGSVVKLPLDVASVADDDQMIVCSQNIIDFLDFVDQTTTE
jgi:hypothetical protein